MFQMSQSLELLAEKNRIQALNQGPLTQWRRAVRERRTAESSTSNLIRENVHTFMVIHFLC